MAAHMMIVVCVYLGSVLAYCTRATQIWKTSEMKRKLISFPRRSPFVSLASINSTSRRRRKVENVNPLIHRSSLLLLYTKHSKLGVKRSIYHPRVGFLGVGKWAAKRCMCVSAKLVVSGPI